MIGSAPGAPCGAGLAGDQRVGFAMILPPFRMADDHRRRADVRQQLGIDKDTWDGKKPEAKK